MRKSVLIMILIIVLSLSMVQGVSSLDIGGGKPGGSACDPISCATSGGVCYDDGTIERCCFPGTCSDLGKDCGTWDDNCGGTVNCGTCSSGDVCSISGTCVTPGCPNGFCESGEDCSSCSADCGTCPTETNGVNTIDCYWGCDSNDRSITCGCDWGFEPSCEYGPAKISCLNVPGGVLVPSCGECVEVDCTPNCEFCGPGVPAYKCEAPDGARPPCCDCIPIPLPEQCASCVPATSCDSSIECGDCADGCGGTISAGTCDFGESCNLTTGICEINAACGDGNIDSGEECDGSNLGTASCSSQGFYSGTLSCNDDCTLNIDACTNNEVCTLGTGDEDSDGKANYDSSDGTPGDSDCPVAVTAISVSTSSMCLGSSMTITCTSSVADVNSIKATLGGAICSYNSWSGNKVSFTCNPSSIGSLIAKCEVDSTKSTVSGSSKSAIVSVSDCGCSVYGDSTSCNGDVVCDWVSLLCDGTKTYNGGTTGVCVDAPLTSECKQGSCGAECDSTNGGCPTGVTCLSDCSCDYGPEVCDTIDNDGNGLVDDGLSRTFSCGVGECYRTVSQSCSSGSWSPICVAGTSTLEICGDGKDNDCDGSIDEGCLATCGNGNVDSGEECDGTTYCTNCICDSGFRSLEGYCVEDNCGTLDPCDKADFTLPFEIGSNCYYGDACVSNKCEYDVDSNKQCGSSTCTATGWDNSACSVCGDGIIEGTEVCDDNNLVNGDGCSSTCTVESGYEQCYPVTPGTVEDCSYSGAPATLGVGACQAGTRTCQNSGIWSSCSGEVVPQNEGLAYSNCNDNLDNDCDSTCDYETKSCGSYESSKDCAFGVEDITIDSGIKASTPFTASCEFTAENVDAVLLEISGDASASCTLTSWIGGGVASFTCPGLAIGSYTATCKVDTSKAAAIVGKESVSKPFTVCDYADIQLTVIDENNKAVPMALVEVVNPSKEPDYTDEDGIANFNNFELGQYISIAATKDNYRADFKQLKIDECGTYTAELLLDGSACSKDCTDWEGLCDKNCEGSNGCEFNTSDVAEVCHGIAKGTWTELNETHWVLCCGTNALDDKRILKQPLDLDGCMKSLAQHKRIVNYGGRPVSLITYVWEGCN